MEFFFLVLMIMMPGCYLTRTIFEASVLIFYTDEILDQESEHIYGDNHLLNFLESTPKIFFLAGAYAYLLRWISGYTITNAATLIEYSNTLKQKKIPILGFTLLSFVSVIFLMIEIIFHTDTSTNIFRGYLSLGFLLASILIQIFVHKFLNTMKLKFPILYSEKSSSIKFYGTLFGLILFIRSAYNLSEFFNMKFMNNSFAFYYSKIIFFIEAIPTAFLVISLWLDLTTINKRELISNEK